jgi:dihydroorotate dehydrogenase
MIGEEVWRRCFELCGDYLGAVVTKSTTINPRLGYPKPRVSRFGDGLLVASGNPNPGIAKMSAEVRLLKAQPGRRVVFGSIVSDPDCPTGDLADEYCTLTEEYAKAGVDGLELNLSCPHLDPKEKEQTIVPAQNSSQVSHLIKSVKAHLLKSGHEHCLVIPKLTGWNCNLLEVANAAEKAGADAVTVSNLFPGTGYYTGLATQYEKGSTDGQLGNYLIAHGKAGYSGKAMQAPVLLMIETLRKHIGIPVIGTGGCATDLDSLVQSFMAGAAVVETVTPFYFSTPGEMGVLLKLKELVNQFVEFLESRGLGCTDDLYQIRVGRGKSTQ